MTSSSPRPEAGSTVHLVLAAEPSPSSESAAEGGRTDARHPLVRFVVRRLAAGVATLIVATMLIFAAVEVLPGNVSSVVLGRNATPARVAALNADLHLNEALPTRYLRFITNLATGHLGDSSASLAQGRVLPVASVIGTPLRNSLILALLTLVIYVPLCLFMGTLAALRAGHRVDHGISIVALAVGAMPEFLVGTVLIVIFFTKLNLLPPVSQINPGQTPFTHPSGLVLPVCTLLGVSAAFGSRLVRASTLEVLGQDFVAMARLNGQTERRVLFRYALRNALGPSIQAIAQTAQYLIGGIIVTETVFDYPGIGNKLVQAVTVRDVQEIAVISTILAAIYISINILADLAVVLVVPKLRTQV
jgi:peptide/nickel transport system permease protein